MTSAEVLKWLEKTGTQRAIKDYARYGIVAKRAYGVPMGVLLKKQKEIGVDQKLSLALWATGCYEARLLATLIGDPALVTKRQMNSWAASFENWGDCDTACFKLFDRVPQAWALAPTWAAASKEFVKRGGFALMACLALHDKKAPDSNFTPWLRLIEEGAHDDRNFVKKGVLWALRGIGSRNPRLRTAARATATRLSRHDEAPCRWVGKSALRLIRST